MTLEVLVWMSVVDARSRRWIYGAGGKPGALPFAADVARPLLICSTSCGPEGDTVARTRDGRF